MNRISVKALLLTASMLLCLTGCRESSEKAPKLRVLLHQPYENAQSDGDSMETELARRLAETLGMEYELISAEKGRRAEEVLRSGDADVALGYTVDSQTAQNDLIYSVTYAVRPIFIATARGDFRNIPAAFQTSYIGMSAELSEQAKEQAKNSDELVLQAYTTVDAAKEGLLSGAIEAYFCYEEEAFSLAAVEGIQVQDAVSVDADRFVVVAPKEGLIEQDSLDFLVLSYLAERGEGG